MAAGLYDITHQTLGKGHFAVVKLAKHCLTGELVAVKIIDKSKLNNEGLHQLGLEISLLSRLSENEHPNIVKLYQVIDTKTKLYLVMEYCGHDVCDLYDYIQKRNSGNGLKDIEARHIFNQICSAIGYCHSLRIVHRDLKPENILIVIQPQEINSPITTKYPLVKLIDFGFSNQWVEGEKLRTSCGSLAYSAPEILLGDHYDGDKVDIWGLGCILYILLYGSNPFMQINDSETLIRILDCTFSTPPRPNISEYSIELIKALLKRDPNCRFTIKQVLKDSWLKDEASEAERFVGDTAPIEPKTPNVPSKPNKCAMHEKVIEQMVANGMCKSRDIVESALSKCNDSTGKTKKCKLINGNGEESIINGEKVYPGICHENYITATYHLLKDKLVREQSNVQQTNWNTSTGFVHKRVLPPRPRKQLIQQSPRIRPGLNPLSEELASNDDTPSVNIISPKLDIPFLEEEAPFNLPLARKCSIVSEEGSCAGTEHSSLECANERLLEIERAEVSGSHPSVDIIVTDCSSEDINEDEVDSTKEVGEIKTVLRASNSSGAALHMVSSSPDFLCDSELPTMEMNQDLNGKMNQNSRQASKVNMILTDKVQEESHDDIAAIVGSKQQKKCKSSTATSMRIIVQSKSCNNILFNEEAKCSNQNAKGKHASKNGSKKGNGNGCRDLMKRQKHSRTDCCSIC